MNNDLRLTLPAYEIRLTLEGLVFEAGNEVLRERLNMHSLSTEAVRTERQGKS